MTSVSEKLLEDEISAHLVAHGSYVTCKVGTRETREDFDAGRGLDTAELFAFIRQTQSPAWATPSPEPSVRRW